MSTYIARAYRGPSDLPPLIEFAERLAAETAPKPSYYHPGDFVWQLAAMDSSDDAAIWMRDGQVAACAVFEPPITFQFDVVGAAPEKRALSSEILRWIEERHARVSGHETPMAYASLHGALSTWAFEHDEERIAVLKEHGYAPAGAGGIRYAQRLDLKALPDLPGGAIVRGVTVDDLDERVDLHRDAWSVWGTSTFSAEQYRRLRAAPLYEPELDIVVEFEARLVSYCVCWMDRRNGVGYFEPVGTRPAYAGRGFGRAALLGGLERLRARGMTLARVGTASINTGAQALYRSAGFVEEARELFYSKRDRNE